MTGISTTAKTESPPLSVLNRKPQLNGLKISIGLALTDPLFNSSTDTWPGIVRLQRPAIT
ncbi:MAG: hypothetical protein EBZ36_04135 [Acidobacteria bacterium]|nr:hypothetical protein [Acidobacteriota bacterium]